ncbi:MAG: bifunctional UDP-N-acetylmuramoyl-tripeptide:D-alanyl-D-alanine ligase/alanine racemase [Prevotellaceae bacterium]|jgi:alanine racemase|nr:bifunctional UDP-N-acetylmuramoyl-tripeptide:D-alanyl-D-alanine ligase/alanine racemase [Prevotellaceae bacterium]
MSYSIEQLAHDMGARRIGQAPAHLNWLLTDSRSLCFPEETLFFALHTKRNDGARYLADLYARGVRNFVLRPESLQAFGIDPATLAEANFLLVDHPLKALQKLAERHRKRFNIPVIGITGSNGKTVVKEWLHQLLSPDRSIVRSPRSYNSQIGVPLSVWQLGGQTQLGIFEAGISELNEMSSLQSIIRPTIGILTNIGSAHQENFFSLQEKCMEKLTLFKDCDVVIYNGDDEFVSNCMSKMLFPVREIAWSCKDVERPLYISRIDKQENTTRIDYRYLGMVNSFVIPFIDDASIENALHCLATCLYLMMPARQITARMAHLEPVAMRLEVKEGKEGCQLINDSYNSDMASLDIALDFLYRRSLSTGLKRTLILSDILESGQSAASLYRRVGQLVRKRGIDRIIGVGRNLEANAAAFDMDSCFFADTDGLMQAVAHGQLRFRDELILIKGARRFGFDALAEVLEKKVHETILEVNLGALVDNLNYYRGLLESDTKMVCMVKASAYGAGSYQIAKTLQEHRVDYLAVAVADEGSELRKAGITAGILVMNPEMTAFKTIFDYELEPEVYSFHLLEALIGAAQRQGITRYPIHLKIDTGMHRLGFAPEEIPALTSRLQAQDSLIVRSVFSHLVGADDARFDDFTQQQISIFAQVADTLQQAFPHKLLRHLCNSAGIQRFPEAQFDMVRLGIGLYGINPVGTPPLHNVSTLRTTILQIRTVEAGDTVGYNRSGKLVRPSRIAALPIGYADGLNRKLGNGAAYCLVGGRPAPYVGNICMDVCMIDVTDIACREGDAVEIFGEGLSVSRLAEVLGTIPYELLTTVSTRVKRIYYQE